MGTKIQCKTYLPGFCSMKDLNNNGTNTPWLLNHESKSRKRSQCTDSVLYPKPVDGYFECDKEKMKQTILKHETIFRHQLQELHRLYRRQRDLMYEHRRKKMLNHQTKTFQSSPSLSRVASPDTKKTWQMSHFHSLDSIAGQLSTMDAAKNQSFFENDSRSNHFSFQVTTSSKECESHQPGRSLFQRKMFNSRFVVDGCTNNEEEHPTRKQWGLPCIPGNPVEGTYQIPQSKTPVANASECHSDADLDRANSSKRTDELADLNKPLPLDEAPPLVPDINISSIIRLEDDINDAGKFFPKSLKERIGGIFLNHSPCWNGEEQLTLTFKLNAEKNQPDNGSSGRLETAETLPKAFQSSQSELSKHSLFKKTKNEHQRKRKIFGVEIHEDNQIQSPSFSNVQTSTHKSQPLPQSYTKLLRDLEAYRSNMHTSGDVGSHSSSKNISPYQNALCKRSQLNAKEVRDCSLAGLDFASSMTGCNLEYSYPKQDWTKVCNHVNDMDSKSVVLKNEKETSCVSQTEMAGKTPVSGDFQRKQENTRETLLWLVVKSQESVEQTKERQNCYHLNLDSLQNYSQQFFRREDTSVNSSQFVDQRWGTLSSRSAEDSESQKIEVSDSTKIRTIFGVPIFSASKDSHATRSLSKATFPDVDSVTATNISEDETVSRKQVEAKDFVQEKGLNGCISGLRYPIDLNLSLDEEEAPSAPPLPQAVVRIATTEIDLEAPAVLESEAECGNSKHTLEEFNKSNKEAMRVAAESIISISMSGVNGEMNDVLQTEPSDCLKWFAELVFSHCSDQECIARKISSGTLSEFDEESIPDGFDYFEFMTLKLEDMKEEEYSNKIPTLERHKDEETVATTLPKLPRRGKARRGRQRKNFQRDVLPGIISLSRYEVNKDILAFEELFKASGSSWQSSLSHRKTGKNGWGRRRLGNADPSPADCTPPVIQPCSSELGLEEKGLTGWGKRTRRLPRQRYLNSNLAIPLKQC